MQVMNSQDKWLKDFVVRAGDQGGDRNRTVSDDPATRKKGMG